MGTAQQTRSSRLEFKTTPDTKELLSQAAAIDGLDLTAFVLGSAVDKARKVIEQHASITLAKDGQEALVRLINKPRAPTREMKALMQLPDLPKRRK
jgi:uncharacterized protein (DUF1778 family)